MPGFSDLLLAYGLCFGAMNKVDFFHGKSKFTDSLLKCSYCTGFHSGWIAYVLTSVFRGFHGELSVAYALSWALASAVFCYAADTVLQLAESWIRKS